MPVAVSEGAPRGRGGRSGGPPRGRGRGRGGAAGGPKNQGGRRGGRNNNKKNAPAQSPEEVAALKEQRRIEYEEKQAARAAAEAAEAAEREAARLAAEKAEADRLAAEKAAFEAAEAKKSPLLRKVEGLVKILDDKKGAEAERAAAAEELATLAADPSYEPYLVSLALPVIMAKLDDKKSKLVPAKCEEAGLALVKNLGKHATRACMQVLFEGLDDSCKWKTRLGTLKFLQEIATSPEHADNFARCLPEVIPVMMSVLWATKPQVKEAANELLSIVFNSVENRDLEPLIPSITSAMNNLNEIPECIQTLASTTFVQTVDATALSVIVPLLVRGFREKTTAIQRQCCVIVTNMSKLVEDAREAAPFLPELLPALTRAADAISDPEARQVAGKSKAHLERIKKASDEDVAKKQAEIDSIIAVIEKTVKDQSINDETLLAHLQHVTNSLCWLNTFDVECVSTLSPYLKGSADDAKTAAICDVLVKASQEYAEKNKVVDDEDDGEDMLCDTKFTLAYGSKVLLHNTDLKLKRGGRYGLLGGNESGKTTLMRALANGSVEGFPPRDEVRTVFVEADIQGEISHFTCTDYVMADEELIAMGVTKEEVRKVLLSVDFTAKMLDDPVSTLSGGWRMKLALARAMMQKADLILMDEPTNHLDVINVQWVVDFLLSTAANGKVTCIMVSHDSGFLDKTATHILHISNLKLHLYKGNLTNFVDKHPEAQSFFELGASKQAFKFPQPGYLEGVKSKGKALMKMENMAFTYPGNDKPTISDITVQVSLSSRVACLGVNGAGKSTLIKVLTGQLEPQTGTVWKHQHARIAYVAQHAFHHIEQHLDKTANEYIRWRYEGGEDKEGLEKASMKISEEEAKKCAEPVVFQIEDEKGNLKKIKMVIEKLTGGRRPAKKGFEYEVKFVGKPMDANKYMKGERLEELGFSKHVKIVDTKVEAREGQYARALTQANVEEHLEDVGLDREFGTHNRMAALSGGQKVKVVLAAAMWNQPHILILDEPTNYLDRDALGALAGAIKEYEGGVVMVTHNNEFCSALCPETWVLEAGKLDCQGDPEWMKSAMKQKVEFKALDEMVDGNGNVMKVKKAKKKLSRKEQKARAKKKAFALANGMEWSDSEDEL